MARRGRGRPGGPGQVKGFRPGKEPTRLKKQRAKAQLGKDATWAQKQTVEAVAGRSPEEVRAMVRKWSLGATLAAVILGLLGIFLFTWSPVVGVVVLVLAAAFGFLAYRIRKQGPGLEGMAESLR